MSDERARCRYLLDFGRGQCPEPAIMDDVDPLLCLKHTADGLNILRLGTEWRRRSEIPMEEQRQEYAAERDGVVYYVAFRDVIKIGTTYDLSNRLAALPGRLLATEPGSFDVEQRRHRQFRNCRVEGEWFLGRDPEVARTHPRTEAQRRPSCLPDAPESQRCCASA